MKKFSCFFLFATLFLALTIDCNAQEGGKPKIVGGDKDKHGCIASAGYTYSQIKATCIRLFEESIKLNEVKHTGTYSSFAVVILSGDKKKAEVFIPGKESQILVKSNKKGVATWSSKSITLTQQEDGFELLLSGKLTYSTTKK